MLRLLEYVSICDVTTPGLVYNTASCVALCNPDHNPDPDLQNESHLNKVHKQHVVPLTGDGQLLEGMSVNVCTCRDLF